MSSPIHFKRGFAGIVAGPGVAPGTALDWFGPPAVKRARPEVAEQAQPDLTNAYNLTAGSVDFVNPGRGALVGKPHAECGELRVSEAPHRPMWAVCRISPQADR